MKTSKRIIAGMLALLTCTAVFTGCGNNGSTGSSHKKKTSASDKLKEADEYTVLVTDEDGDPVKGVTVEFCSDSECEVGVTDKKGTVTFDQPEGKYYVHVLEVPDGYAEDDTEYKTPKKYGTVTITLVSDSAGDEEDDDDAPEGEVSFETTDLDGNTVKSKDIFKGYKVTVINLWATWCGPCTGELEELGKLAKDFEDLDCRLIGVCVDGAESARDAKSLLNENDCDYLNLVATDEILDILDTVGYPTTFFVDSHGNMLAEPVLGAYVDKYPEVLEECLDAMD